MEREEDAAAVVVVGIPSVEEGEAALRLAACRGQQGNEAVQEERSRGWLGAFQDRVDSFQTDHRLAGRIHWHIVPYPVKKTSWWFS